MTQYTAVLKVYNIIWHHVTSCGNTKCMCIWTSVTDSSRDKVKCNVGAYCLGCCKLLNDALFDFLKRK